MARHKRKLSKAERAAKARRNADFEIIFINGKQKRMRRHGGVEGMTMEEFILANADPIWLHQNEIWEYMTPTDGEGESVLTDNANELPF
jgi:hypothetical protein